MAGHVVPSAGQTMGGSPLLGYNTNVRHAGRLYHIQTEDSGATHGHIFTHLFADGGRIIASKKTTYAQYIGTTQYPEAVKLLMRESHKAMFIALRDGLFDDDEVAGAKAMAAMVITLDGSTTPEASPAPPPPAPTPSAEVDVEALERAAEAKLASATPSRYASTRPAAVTPPPRAPSKPARRPDPASESIFGGDLLSEKSLDEVILSYLAEDVDGDG